MNAFGDIAHNCSAKLATAGLDSADGGLGWKLCAVGAKPPGDERPHLASGSTCLAKLLQVPAMRRAQTLRNEASQGLSDGLLGTDQEHLLGSRVEQHNALFGIKSDYRVR